MKQLIRGRNTAAMVIAIIALIAAVTGAAVASPGAVDSKKKKGLSAAKVRAIADSEIAAKASSLSVASANTAKGLTGVVIVRGPTQDNLAGDQDSQTVDCPSGLHALSGGLANDGGIEESINDGFITSNNTGYRAHVNNDGSAGDDTFHVWVLCANAAVSGGAV
ncbi:MAG: hypothetical protein ACJ76D_09150 [Solirubrobacterales bacterium]